MYLALAAGGPAAASGVTATDPPDPAVAPLAGMAPGLPAPADHRPARGARAPDLEPPPDNRSDLPAWLAYRAHNHLDALPREARLFYRRGLMMRQSGSREEAVRLVRGASELDPWFVAPHLTLASWFLLREPSQALLHYAAVIEQARQNFLLQLALTGNALYLGLEALFLGLLGAAMIVVLLHQRELRHPWTERLSRFLSPASAGIWSWAFLALPYVAGFGAALPTAVFLALLWPVLRVRERVLFVALTGVLVAMPWSAGALDRFSVALREDGGPFHGVPLVGPEPWSPERAARFARLADARPDDPFVQFAAGWTARQGGALSAAESRFRRTLELWPGDDRVMNDLGNALAMQGRSGEALALYVRASQVNPANPAALFNASQIYTQRYDYRAATDALSRASALNFDLVKSYQSQTSDEGRLPLVDQWLAPRTFWAALSRLRERDPARALLPPTWRARIECSGRTFSALALLLAALALALGVWQHRVLPLRGCSSCGRVICRRCAVRQHVTALCPACAAVQARAESPEFARVLLLQHRRHVRGADHLVRTALATLIPGYGLLAFRRVVLPVLLLAAAAALAIAALGLGEPFRYEARLALPGQEVPAALVIGLWVVIYAISITGYFAEVARAEADEAAAEGPVRGRVRIPGRQTAAAA
ncbi:MAG: hypothetical protein HZC42_15805 [Candidatus Eisenbacteria bacterium]|nr:hypothetical protein [Candidatus Eisenbacteria bacterium]